MSGAMNDTLWMVAIGGVAAIVHSVTVGKCCHFVETSVADNVPIWSRMSRVCLMFDVERVVPQERVCSLIVGVQFLAPGW